LSNDWEIAQQVAAAMTASFEQIGIGSEVYVSKINKQGPKVIE
jgi:homoserine kinase